MIAGPLPTSRAYNSAAPTSMRLSRTVAACWPCAGQIVARPRQTANGIKGVTNSSFILIALSYNNVCGRTTITGVQKNQPLRYDHRSPVDRVAFYSHEQIGRAHV